MKTNFIVFAFSLALTLSACSAGQPEVGLETRVAATLASMEGQTAEQACPTSAPCPTSSPYPTYTPWPTYTPYPTPEQADGAAPAEQEPEVVNTPEPQGGVGEVVMCGELFSIKVLEKPVERKSVVAMINDNRYVENATGEFLFIKFELVNTSGETWDTLFLDEFFLIGTLDGKRVTYRSEFDATNYMTRNMEYANYLPVFYQETQPEVVFKTVVGFDVNPLGTDWVFVFRPLDPETGEVACEVHIPMQ